MRRKRVAIPKTTRVVDLRPKKVYQPIGRRIKFDDAALDRFHSTREQGRSYTADEIAVACNVSPQRISELEHAALRKLRAAMGVEADELQAIPVRDFFQRHPVHLPDF